jgi:hypothetical protein
MNWSKTAWLSLRSGVFGALIAASLATAAQPSWVAQGPSPATGGQVENLSEGEVSGALKSIAVHPSAPNVIYVGSVNGGVWKTANAMDPRPTWTQLTDDQASLSIGAVEFDPTDATTMTLVAGIGRFSSLGTAGGRRAGILRTTDGGQTWTLLDGGGILRGLNVAGVAPRGDFIMIAANDADDGASWGIWRSANRGASWTKVSGATGSGLPDGPVVCLAGDPSSSNILYATGGNAGLFRSTDTGQTWSNVGSPAMTSLLAQLDNAKIAVGNQHQVFIAIDVAGNVAGVFRSPDGINQWTAMDRPGNVDGGVHSGSQGYIHLSLAAEPSNKNVLYIGGDAQPTKVVAGVRRFPNSIGAQQYSGRLFRGDASKPAGKQWVHLTHSKVLGPAGGGTKSGSAPHADSRDMRIAVNGTLIEVDDGGIYRRTSPTNNNGDWFSMNGNLQVTEFHAVAWDRNGHLAIGGAQDTGTPGQQLKNNVSWPSVSTSDGGVVAVEQSVSGKSIRYSSAYSLLGFRRQTFDASNRLLNDLPVKLKTPIGVAPLAAQFYTPFTLNEATMNRIVIGGKNGVYESLDGGDTLRLIGPFIAANANCGNSIAYGATNEADRLYIGSGSMVFSRKKSVDVLAPTAYTGGVVAGIAIDPTDGEKAYAASENAVFTTPNGGTSWTELTGNLGTLSPAQLRTIAYCPCPPSGKLFVGAENGVLVASGPVFTSWSILRGLPHSAIYQLSYDAADDVLVVGTLGRGAWSLTGIASPPAAPLLVTNAVASGLVASIAPGAPAAIMAPPPTAPADPPRLKNDPVTKQASPPKSQTDAATPASDQSFTLTDGIVVDMATRRIFYMTPDGKVGAVGIDPGKKLWSNAAGAKPIGIANAKVIAQMEDVGGINKLRVVSIDTKSGASGVRSKTVALPANVVTSVTDTLDGTFTAAAFESANNDADISWQFTPRVPSPIAPGTQSMFPESAQSPQPAPPMALLSNEPANGGALHLDLQSGALTPAAPGLVNVMPPAAMLQAPLQAPLQPSGDNAPTSVQPGETLSADGRHILVAEKTDEAGALYKYTLSVWDARRKLLGAFRSFASTVPFFVTGSRVIYETPSYIERVGDELVTRPRMLRAADLDSGQEIWSVIVRDNSYHGPFPP